MLLSLDLIFSIFFVFVFFPPLETADFLREALLFCDVTSFFGSGVEWNAWRFFDCSLQVSFRWGIYGRSYGRSLSQQNPRARLTQYRYDTITRQFPGREPKARNSFIWGLSYTWKHIALSYFAEYGLWGSLWVLYLNSTSLKYNLVGIQGIFFMSTSTVTLLHNFHQVQIVLRFDNVPTSNPKWNADLMTLTLTAFVATACWQPQITLQQQEVDEVWDLTIILIQ